MKVTVLGGHERCFAASVLDVDLPVKDAPVVKSWGSSGPGILESSQPTAFSHDIPASLR
jgi:hypothetical protein